MHARARFHADLEGSGAGVSDVRVNELINTHLCTVWLELVNAGPSDYYSADQPYTTSTGILSYPLPDNFLRATRVLRVQDSQRSFPITPIEGDLRGDYRPPQGQFQLTMEYIPTAPVIDTSAGGDSTAFDGVAGYEELICKLVARDMAAKEGSADVRDRLDAESRFLLERIRSTAKRTGYSRDIVDREAEQRGDYWYSTGVNTIRAFRIRAGNIEFYDRRVVPG